MGLTPEEFAGDHNHRPALPPPMVRRDPEADSNTLFVSPAADEPGDGYHHQLPMIDLNAGSEMKKEEDNSSSSLSDSDSDSDSDDDFFQIDAPELIHPPPPPPPASEPEPEPEPMPEDMMIDLITNHLNESDLATNGAKLGPSAELHGREAIGGAARGGDDERQSPAVQVMARSDAPDPNRIPSSVFARSTAASPMEWSAASNESLFSIHMGNTSFSRDHVFLMGRSGDLTGIYMSGPLEYPPPLPPATTPQQGRTARARLVDVDEMDDAEDVVGSAEAASANDEAMKEVMRKAAEGKEKETSTAERLGHSISRHSDGSTTSFRSFAFPILTGDGKNGSMRGDSMHHFEHQPHLPVETRTPKARTLVAGPVPLATATPSSAQSRWFPCFSCCSFCC